ncbi:hypothetical protein MJN85_30345, partial [Salmonella enterica subsp. enterica serovar Anatum]|nr:hypothetical protein [Salmonella enterica subsp. enterica serovar Anatum]
YTPRFEWFAILTILPAALVVIAEHVGHLVVTANIVKKDLVRDSTGDSLLGSTGTYGVSLSRNNSMKPGNLGYTPVFSGIANGPS